MADDETNPAQRDEPELDALRSLVGGRPVEEVTWEEPPAGLWDRIAAELDVPAAEPTAPRPDAGAPPELRPPTDLGSRRRAVPWLVGAAAAVVLLVVGVAVLVDRSSSSDVVASAQLDRLGPAGSGAAELVEEDGRYRLRVDTADLDPGDGFLEVWVIDSDVSKLVSLGPERPDGTYDLPPDLDPRMFPLVDVSVEPLDGDPAHSGDSVLRGQLAF